MEVNLRIWIVIIGSLYFASGELQDLYDILDNAEHFKRENALDINEYFKSDNNLHDLYNMKREQGPYSFKHTYRHKRLPHAQEYAALLYISSTEECVTANNIGTMKPDPANVKKSDNGIIKEKNRKTQKDNVEPKNYKQYTNTNTKPYLREKEKDKVTSAVSSNPSIEQHTTNGENSKSPKLYEVIQHLYVAQGRVKLEEMEIKKAQSVASSAQQSLDEAANHVRSVSGALQTAQQELASAAIRAQKAQLQLAAHTQLLFAARQDEDALSSDIVGLQAAEGISAPNLSFDVKGLLEKLKQPLLDSEKPTAVPAVCPYTRNKNPTPKSRRTVEAEDYYEDAYED